MVSTEVNGHLQLLYNAPTLFLNQFFFTPSHKFMDNKGLKKEPGLSVKLWSAPLHASQAATWGPPLQQ